MVYGNMERRVFKFGTNSVALIVPKKWLDKSGLKPHSQVFVSESESGNLIISPTETVKQESERIVNSKTKPTFLSRWVGLHYMYGVGKLRVYSADGLAQNQLDAIEAKINSECPGFEITSQSSNDIIIEDLTNIREIDIEKIIGRLRSLINQEFFEMTQGDIKSVVKIERLVNRFYMLGTRYVNVTQARDATTYFGLLGFLEQISDKMATIASDFEIMSGEVFKSMKAQFDMCFVALNGDDKAIEEVAEMRERIVAKLSRAKIDKLYEKLLIEIADDITGIAEFGLRAEKKGQT